MLTPRYTVQGVYADPDELRRRAYGIADVVVPGGFRSEGGSSGGDVALLVRGSRMPTVESHVRAALARRYGDQVAVAVWEGPPRASQGAPDDVRTTVRAFSSLVNLLGAVMLVTVCLGMFSIMFVEMAGRARQVAIARAFGAAKSVILREFLARSLILAGTASVVGVALSALLAPAITDLVAPIFGGAVDVASTGSVITPAAVAAGLAAAIGAGGVLGALPALWALGAPIAEGMRG